MRFVTRLSALISLVPALTRAAPLPSPSGPIILSLTGKIQHTNGDGVARFDCAMLEALGLHFTTTHTPWSNGPIRFEGPLGRGVLEAVGATGAQLRVRALSDYSASVPVSDFYQHDVILAMKKEGAYMQVRDRGPLFVIYPFDDAPLLQNEVYFGRSVWQVRAIHID